MNKIREWMLRGTIRVQERMVCMRRKMKQKNGQTMVDYVIVLALVVTLAIAVITPLRNAVVEGVTNIIADLKNVFTVKHE